MSPHFFNSVSSTWRVISIFTIAVSGVISQAQDNTNPTPEIVKVSAKGLGAFGGDVDIQTHVFKPNGAGPFPVLQRIVIRNCYLPHRSRNQGDDQSGPVQ